MGVNQNGGKFRCRVFNNAFSELYLSTRNFDKLRIMFATHDLPISVVLDNGPPFICQLNSSSLLKLMVQTIVASHHTIHHLTAQLRTWWNQWRELCRNFQVVTVLELKHLAFLLDLETHHIPLLGELQLKFAWQISTYQKFISTS